MSTNEKDFIMKVGDRTYIFFPTPQERKLLLEAVKKAQENPYHKELLEKDPIVNIVKRKLLY